MQIAPFRPLLYNPAKISFIARVVAPPYDVIDQEQAQELRERDPHNVIRLILGKGSGEPRESAEYELAARTFAAWRREGVLVREESHAIYLCEHAFELDGESHVRRGVLGALLLDDSPGGRALPHEGTLSGPLADRLALMTACRANLSAVLGLFSDPDGAVDAQLGEMTEAMPLYEFCAAGDIVQKVWRVTDPDRIAALASALREQSLVIADGHHRYQTAIAYRERNRNAGQPPAGSPEDYMPALCVSVKNSALVTLPTHRLAKADGGFDPAAFLSAVGKYFEVEPVPFSGPEGLQQAVNARVTAQELIGCHLRGQRFYVFWPRGDAVQAVLPDHSTAWRRLPVTLLHYAVLEPGFGIPPEPDAGHPRLLYSQNLERMFWSVEAQRFDAGLYLPPTNPATVQAIAQAGERMPPKSTYFYPKVDSGLLFYPFEKESMPTAP